MSDLSLSDLPADLQAQLAAVGVTDTTMLQAALDAEPALRHELEAFLATNQLASLLGSFAAVANPEELAAFWQHVPLELEDPFIAIVEQQIAQDEEEGDNEVANGLRQRLEGLRQFQAQQREKTAQIQGALTALADVENNQQLLELWQGIPLELEDAFLNIVASRAEGAAQAGNDELAARLGAQLATLREVQAAQRQQSDQPQSHLAQSDLPDDLKTRLTAVGVTDEESLQRAMAADPELERDLLAALAERHMQQLLNDFVAVPDFEALVQFWRQVPSEQEEAFIAIVEAQIAGAEQENQSGLAEALRLRLDGVRQLRG